MRTRLLVDTCLSQRLAFCLASFAPQTTYLPSGDIASWPLMSSSLIFPPVVSAVILGGPNCLGGVKSLYSPKPIALATNSPSTSTAIDCFLYCLIPVATNCTLESARVSVKSPECAVDFPASCSVVPFSTNETAFEVVTGATGGCDEAARLISDIKPPDSIRCFNRFNLPSIAFAV